jgi:hypothetical protein
VERSPGIANDRPGNKLQNSGFVNIESDVVCPPRQRNTTTSNPASNAPSPRPPRQAVSSRHSAKVDGKENDIGSCYTIESRSRRQDNSLRSAHHDADEASAVSRIDTPQGAGWRAQEDAGSGVSL